MKIKPSQRQAVLAVLSPNEVLNDKEVIEAIMKRFDMSKAHAVRGLKNVNVMDLKVKRSVFRTMGQWIVYYRLADTPAPRNHQDFEFSPVVLGLNKQQHEEWRRQRDALAATVRKPWEESDGQTQSLFQGCPSLADSGRLQGPFSVRRD